MRKLFLTFATCLLLTAGSSLLAQELKIGFVSTERVFKEATPAVKALKKLEAEFAPREADLYNIIARHIVIFDDKLCQQLVDC